MPEHCRTPDYHIESKQFWTVALWLRLRGTHKAKKCFHTTKVKSFACTSKRSCFFYTSDFIAHSGFEVDEISSNWNVPPCIANILRATVLNRLVVSHPALSPSTTKFLAQQRHYLEDPFQSGQNNELSSFGKWLLKAWHSLLEIIWETRTVFCLPWSKVSVVFICS